MKRTEKINDKNMESTEETLKQLQLVTFKQAKKLKEAGFDWKVYYWYNSDGSLSCFVENLDRNTKNMGVSAPNIALALKWISGNNTCSRNTQFINRQIA